MPPRHVDSSHSRHVGSSPRPITGPGWASLSGESPSPNDEFSLNVPLPCLLLCFFRRFGAGLASGLLELFPGLVPLEGASLGIGAVNVAWCLYVAWYMSVGGIVFLCSGLGNLAYHRYPSRHLHRHTPSRAFHRHLIHQRLWHVC